MADQFMTLKTGHLSGTLIIPLKGEGGPAIKNLSVRHEEGETTGVIRAETSWLDKPVLEAFVDFIQSSERVSVSKPRESETGKSLMVSFSAEVSEDLPVRVRKPMPSDDGSISERWSRDFSQFVAGDIAYIGEQTTYEDAQGEEHITSKPFILTSVGDWSTKVEADENDFASMLKAASGHFAKSIADDSDDPELPTT